ncbi:MAG TPA: hypothetical protein VGM05_31855 [Planctomycetaceae bacterium]|jgi:hypothetical protein
MNRFGGLGSSFVGGLRNRVFVVIIFFAAAPAATIGWTDDGESGKEGLKPSRLVKEDMTHCKVMLTVRGGGGLEALRFAWHSVDIPSEGPITVRAHRSIDGTEENATSDPNATVLFRDEITAEQRAKVISAAASAVNHFELQRSRPGGSVSEDGWKVMLKLATSRREVSVKARDLTNVRDAGDDFPRLIEEINKVMPEKSAIRFR